MRPVTHRFGLSPGDRRGIALPLALLGLVLVTVLVIGVLLGSATEAALSGAHQDATRALYTAEGAIEAYVAQQGTALAPTSSTAFSPDGNSAVEISVTHLGSLPTPLPGVQGNLFSVRAEPASGGRAVAAMVRVGPLGFGIDQAATFGGSSMVGGNALISDGRDSESCSPDSAASNAIVHAAGTVVNTPASDNQNQQPISGAVRESPLTGEELIRATLGGFSIPEMMQQVHDRHAPAPSPSYVTFGANPIWGSADAFSGSGQDVPRSWQQQGGNLVPRSAGAPYNWYCPGEMDVTVDACVNIVAPGDTAAYKLISIDGGGGDVTIQGDHGQGLLMVVNGRLKIRGNFVFRGLIVGEGDIDISGTGNKIEGAVVSAGTLNLSQQNVSDGQSSLTGNTTIRYNRCAINGVNNAMGSAGDPLVVSRTFGWTEVVR